MRIVQEEVFGPVLTIERFSTEDEAIALGNDTAYGLAGAVWTADAERAQRVAARLRHGTIWINTYNVYVPQAEWGGYKQSGIGRELGPTGLDEYREAKHIWESTAPGPSGWFGSSPSPSGGWGPGPSLRLHSRPSELVGPCTEDQHRRTRRRQLMRRVLGVFGIAGLAIGASWLIVRRRRDGLRDFVSHRFDPVVMRFGLAGGRVSPWGTVEHLGRTTGTVHRTPIYPRTFGDHVYIPLPYGTDVQWVRNIQAAGHCRLGLHATTSTPTSRRSSATDNPLLPPRLQAVFVRRGRSYLRLHILDRVPGVFSRWCRSPRTGRFRTRDPTPSNRSARRRASRFQPDRLTIHCGGWTQPPHQLRAPTAATTR